MAIFAVFLSIKYLVIFRDWYFSTFPTFFISYFLLISPLHKDNRDSILHELPFKAAGKLTYVTGRTPAVVWIFLSPRLHVEMLFPMLEVGPSGRCFDHRKRTLMNISIPSLEGEEVLILLVPETAGC